MSAQVLFLRDLPPPPVTPAPTCTHLLDLGAPCLLACAGCARHESPAALRHAARTLLASAQSGGSAQVRAVLYGGDPFLRAEEVTALLDEASAACASRGARLVPVALASGAAITAPRARALRAAGLAAVEVTLDGTRERHDARRPLAAGGGSWDAIVHALKHEREGLPALIRMEAPHGDPEVERLADALDAEGLFAAPSPVLLVAGPPASYRERARDLLRVVEAGRLPAGPPPDGAGPPG